ncbi:MAG: hypothetical protein ACRD30_03600 [Bryobacteraceae bacterium]
MDESIRLNRQLMREIYAKRARFALSRVIVLYVLAAILILTAIVLLGALIVRIDWRQAWLVWPSLAAILLATGVLAAMIAQIVLARRLLGNQPVAKAQRHLETAKRFRIRYIRASFLAFTVACVPLPILVAEVRFGVNPFDTTWIVVNELFGVAVFVIGLWLLRKYGSRVDAIFRKIYLTRKDVSAADEFLTKLSQFEDENAA